MPHNKNNNPDSTLNRLHDHDEEIEELKDWVDKRKIQDIVNQKVRIICISTTTTFLTFCLWLGNAVYENSHAVAVAVKAFWNASGDHK